MRKRYFLAAIALTMQSSALFSQAIIHTAVPVGAGSEAEASATARMVEAIFDYTRWPAKPQTIRLCVLGQTRHAAQLGNIVLTSGTRVERKSVSAVQVGNSCDALYVGGLPPAMTRQAIAVARGKAIVTLAENDPECASEAMFCLVFKSASLSFLLNVDAVSRSAVRVDPRVLRMSKGY